MKSRVLILTTFILALATLARGESPPKLNVLFIMSDQHNARALGCYGNDVVKTPNLDRLAGEGVLFTRAICQTGQCVPSRYSIWTGRYARSTGTYSNGQGQNPEENTVADLFKQAGYVTATFGKHHMIMGGANANHGFDVVEDVTGGWEFDPQATLPYDDVHPGRSKVGRNLLPNDQSHPGMIMQKTVRFLREHKDRPFVAWYSFHGPHTPICPSSPWAEMYDWRKLDLPPSLHQIDQEMPGADGLLAKSGTYGADDWHRKTLAFYYAYVSQIDYNIGRVLDELDELGLADHTIVVYTADHGEMMAEHGAWTKGSTGYEATIHVPMIVRLPGVIRPGTRVGELACSIDLLPTLLDAAGLDVPANVQGRSLIPLARGEAKDWRRYAVSELGGSVDNQVLTITSRTHKYVRFKRGGKVEHEQLFDLRQDPWEMHNLIDDPAGRTAAEELKHALAEWELQTPVAQPIVIERSRKKAPARSRRTARPNTQEKRKTKT